MISMNIIQFVYQCENCVYIAYRIVVADTYSYGSAVQGVELFVYKRGTVKSASYGNIVFIEIIADICGRKIFVVKRYDTAVVNRVKFDIFYLFESVY